MRNCCKVKICSHRQRRLRLVLIVRFETVSLLHDLQVVLAFFFLFEMPKPLEILSLLTPINTSVVGALNFHLWLFFDTLAGAMAGSVELLTFC